MATNSRKKFKGGRLVLGGRVVLVKIGGRVAARILGVGRVAVVIIIRGR